MKLAAGDFAVWLIIAIIVAVGKLWNKFITMQADEDEPTPSAPPPLQRAQPAQRRMPTQRREVERKPHTEEVRLVPEETRQVQPKDLRDLMERLARPPQPKPVAPPPVKPLPVPKAAEPAPKTVPAAAKPAPEPTRASRWVEALRDRQNLRNIIISAEIIGPPRGA
jgi:cell division protein FtsN